jgi:hypothetical protein
MKKVFSPIAFLLLYLLKSNSVSAQCGFSISTTVTNVTCNGGTNGSIAVVVTGGSAPYQYQQAEAGAGAWGGTSTFVALAANNYPISVKDASGCIQTVYATVTQPTALALTYTETDATCVGANNGTITTNVTGGLAPYTYNWIQNSSGTTFSTSADLTNLSPANYQLVVTDASNCTTSPVVTQQVKPITVTGFTQDVIANGASTSATSSTTTQIDQNPGNVFYASGYSNSNGSGSYSLPASGSFNSAQTSSRSYQLASYSSNNVLLLHSSSDPSTGGTTTGTLTFNSAYQSPYSQLYVVGTTGSGSGVINYTVNFSDATTQTGSLNFPDWSLAFTTSSSIRALGSIGRVSRANPGAFDAGGANSFNLWEAPISITGTNQTKIISNINFTWSSSSSSTSARTSLFAITGYTSTTAGIRVNDGTFSSAAPAVAVTSDAPSNIFCSGETVTFTANPSNGGTSPTYQWLLGGVNISGATSPTYTSSSLANGNQISVTMTSNLACKTTPTATSSAVAMTLGTVSAAVTATASNNGICSGTNVMFMATPTNGGGSPSYQWKLLGINIPGATSSTYSGSSFLNGDLITVALTSSIGCATGNPATSSPVTMNVTTTLSPTALISSLPLVPRNGNAVTFSALITNGGGSPSYQWYKNGSLIVGANSSSYSVASASLADQYSLKLVSSAACLSAPAVMSNFISIIGTLPVLIESFDIAINKNNVLLTWVTSDESGNKDFIIQRAASPFSQFEKIGTVAATDLNAGSSYQFTDKNVTPGMYQYKLIQEDVDGTQTVVGIKAANIIAGNIWSISDLQSGWQIKSQLPLTYQLMDLDGRILETGSMNGSKIITKPFASSIYLMKIVCDGQTQIQKLIR